MTVRIIACCLIFIGVGACSQQPQSVEDQLLSVFKKIKKDRNHDFFKTLEPDEADCQFIFKEEYVQGALNHSRAAWAQLEQLPEDGMKPETDNAKAKVIAVSKRELQSGVTKGLPKGYTKLSDFINDGVSVYGMQYLNEDGSIQKTRSAFFKAGEKWVFIPFAYQAFEE